ncbi:unnamed protein product [Didymodactylos carnosus]|uniref:Reverse transcriptase/retrotransposon-derived protein RNase H-like domain-containing protein n=1 Tax=Didymodactylos carnosus TaxID=1234261 RepID=A0A8S2YJN2_9BILA|nr:unnamed protein product [Didymodactylos carnosus]
MYRTISGILLSAGMWHFCSLARKQLDYLGFRITQNDIKPTTMNVKKTIDFPTPTSTKAAYSFVQMAQFYRRFIKDFASIAAPLNMSKNKNATFQRTRECQKSFDTLKEKLSQYPLLAFYNGKSKLKVKINTDASTTGIGGVLHQVFPDGHLQPVQYLSRSLSTREQKYSVVEKECLAMVWCIGKLRPYLYGREFTFVNSQVNNIHMAISSPFDSSKIQEQQQQDKTIKQLYDRLTSGQHHQSNVLENGILHKILHLPDRITVKLPYIPQSMIDHLLHAYHDSPTSGHLGINKTWHKIRDRYF